MAKEQLDLYILDVELVLRLDRIHIEAANSQIAAAEARAVCREYGDCVDYSVTNSAPIKEEQQHE